MKKLITPISEEVAKDLKVGALVRYIVVEMRSCRKFVT